MLYFSFLTCLLWDTCTLTSFTHLSAHVSKFAGVSYVLKHAARETKELIVATFISFLVLLFNVSISLLIDTICCILIKQLLLGLLVKLLQKSSAREPKEFILNVLISFLVHLFDAAIFFMLKLIPICRNCYNLI